MTPVNDVPQLVMNFEVNAGGRFPNEIPETSPTISNSSLTADALNVKFDPIVIGDRRVRIREIGRVKAGETIDAHLTVHGPDGEPERRRHQDHAHRLSGARAALASPGAAGEGLLCLRWCRHRRMPA